MKIKKLKDDRYQVMRDDGASLALSYEEWEEAFDWIWGQEVASSSPLTSDMLRQMLDNVKLAPKNEVYKTSK